MPTKTILLLRHAHSEPADREADLERPLSGRGRKEARRLGGLLRRLDLKIDLVVSSSARRAQETAGLAGGGAGYSKKIRVQTLLYEAGAAAYLQLLRGLPARSACVLVVGHNPAIREAAAALLGCLPECLRLPAAALACLQAAAGDWEAVRPGTCALEWLLTPELGAAIAKS